MLKIKKYLCRFDNGKNFRQLCSKFAEDCRAVAALEFALVVPFMLFFMIGATATYDMMQGSKNYSKVTNILVDLVTRETSEFNDTKFDTIVATAEVLMGDYGDVDDLTITISSIENVFDTDDDPTLTVDWSKSNVVGVELTNAELPQFDLPSVPEGDTIIMVQVSGTYSPYIITDIINAIEFERHAIRRPRFLVKLDYL